MNSEHQNIVLTGFMATGKTTVGKLIAERLARRFFDIDTAIEYRTGLTIPRIFAQYGELFFRGIEQGICYEVAMLENLVVATGGGALINPESRQALQETSLIVCLHADPAQIETRLKQSDGRPLAATWQAKYAERLSIYQSFEHQIATSDKTPDDIAEEVVSLWKKYVSLS